MAGPLSTNRRTRPTTIQCIAAALVALLIVMAIIIILWVVLRPAKLHFSVDHAAVHGFNVTAGGVLNGTVDLTLRAYNRNKRAGVYYDHVAVAVWFSDQDIADADAPAFYQPPQNETRLDVAATAMPAELPPDVVSNIKTDRSTGKVSVEVRVRAKVRFRIGAVKTRHYTVHARCSPVVIDFATPTTFDRVYCDVDI